MSYNEEYMLVWAGLIVQQYEKAAMEAAVREQNRDACAVTWLKSMKAMEMTLDSSERVVKGESPDKLATAMFGLTGSESEPDQDPTPKTKSQKSEWGEEDSDWWGSAEWTGGGIRRTAESGRPGDGPDIDACDKIGQNFHDLIDPDVEFQGLGVETPGFKVDAHWDGAKALGDGLAALGVPLDSLPEDMDSYLENCWSCMLNLDFSWQVPPINLLAEIENLLKMLEDLIDWMLSRYDSSYDFLKEMLCDWDWIWKLLCLPDLIALMAMLRGLLMKYMMDFFGLTLDWTGIVGPIIKAVVDALAALVEQLVALILQPIECLIGVLKTIDAFIHGVADLAVSSWDFGAHIGNIFGGDFTGFSGKGNTGGTFQATVGQENNMKFAAAWSDIVPDWGDNNKGPNKTDDPGEAAAQSVSWTGPATGFSFSAGTTLSGATEKGVFKKPEFNALGSMILGLQELKSWINQLAQQLIYAIKSLSLLFGGQLKLSVMKSGLIMLVIDMIALVKAIIELFANGLDGFCSEEEAEDVAAILSEIYGEGTEFSVIGGQEDDSAAGLALRARRTADGTIVDIPITECSLDIDRLPDNVRMPFEALQENTEYRREKWGI